MSNLPKKIRLLRAEIEQLPYDKAEITYFLENEKVAAVTFEDISQYQDLDDFKIELLYAFERYGVFGDLLMKFVEAMPQILPALDQKALSTKYLWDLVHEAGSMLGVDWTTLIPEEYLGEGPTNDEPPTTVN